MGYRHIIWHARLSNERYVSTLLTSSSVNPPMFETLPQNAMSTKSCPSPYISKI